MGTIIATMIVFLLSLFGLGSLAIYLKGNKQVDVTRMYRNKETRKEITEKTLEHKVIYEGIKRSDYERAKDIREEYYDGIGNKAFLVTLFSLLSLLVLLFGTFTSIKANEVGIIFDELNGGVLEETYDQGIHTKSIFQKITKIKTINRTAHIDVFSQTADSIYADFEITVVYKIEKENAGKFFRVTNKDDIPEKELNSIVKKHLQSITTQYNIFDIMGRSLEDMRKDFRDVLEEDLLNIYSITLVSVSIDDVDAGTDIEKIIQDKAKAIQEIEIAEQQKARAKIEAQTELIKAENQAEIEKTVALGKAEAQELLNSVAVTAIQKMYLAQFITEENKQNFEVNNIGGYLSIQEIGQIVVKQLYYDIWDGKLPDVITDGTGIIIQP